LKELYEPDSLIPKDLPDFPLPDPPEENKLEKDLESEVKERKRKILKRSKEIEKRAKSKID